VLDQTERSGIVKDSGVVSIIGAPRSPTAAICRELTWTIGAGSGRYQPGPNIW